MGQKLQRYQNKVKRLSHNGSVFNPQQAKQNLHQRNSKTKNHTENSETRKKGNYVDLDEVANYEPPHLDLR